MKKFFSILLVVASACISTFANAESPVDQIIAKVTKAYGGDVLISATSIEITDYSKNPWPGQGATPELPAFFRDHSILTIDLVGKRKSMLSWRVSRSGKDLDRFVFDGKKGRIYDILNHKYTDDNYYNFENLGRSAERASDTMIARKLALSQAKVAYQGATTYLGQAHHKLSFKIENNPEYTLLIDQASGLIAKMSRLHPTAGEISYLFSNHQESGGVMYAREMDFYVGGKPQKISIKRGVAINPKIEGLFAMPQGYLPWGQELMSSALQVRELANKVYHVGQGRSFSLFVDVGDYFIAAGGEKGLKEYFQAVQQFTQITKPLKYVVISHHHSEHLGILDDAATLGATIVTAKEHVSAIKDSLSRTLSDNRFLSVDKYQELGGDALQIHNISTAHSQNYLLVYLPQAKIIFGEDHFETQLKDAVPRVHKDMVTFHQTVQALNIDVERFIDGHSLRQLSSNELKQATEAFNEVDCPMGYAICANG